MTPLSRVSCEPSWETACYVAIVGDKVVNISCLMGRDSREIKYFIVMIKQYLTLFITIIKVQVNEPINWPACLLSTSKCLSDASTMEYWENDCWVWGMVWAQPTKLHSCGEFNLYWSNVDIWSENWKYLNKTASEGCLCVVITEEDIYFYQRTRFWSW